MTCSLAYRSRLWPTLIFVSYFILSSCAEVASPPGGEEDKTGPFMIGSIPANGALEVAPTDLITIQFSEPLIEPIGNSVFISPRPAIKPEVKFKGDRIQIELAEPIAPDRTYIVTLHSQITDRRRNKIDSLASIAFSTGDRIDSGQVSGMVLAQNSRPLESKPAAGALVGLWDKTRLVDSIPVDSIYPDYLTTTSKNGEFSFGYLPDREYRLAAFNDKNKDERLSPLLEAYALPDRPVLIENGSHLDQLIMRLSQADTASIAILSASYTADKLIRVRTSRPIQLDPMRLPFVRSTIDSTVDFPAISMRKEADTLASQFTLQFAPLPEGEYDLYVPISEEFSSIQYAGLSVTEREDKSPPKVDQYLPGEQPVFLDEANISLLFSEPIDSTLVSENSFSLWDAEDQQLPLTYVWDGPFRLNFGADLTVGGEYSLRIAEFDIADLAGNALGDSLVDYRLSIFNDDSLGSVSGRVLLAERHSADARRVVEMVKVGSQQSFTAAVDGDQFSLSLPAGKYLLWGLVDRDQNGVITDGTWNPLTLSETIGIYPDTVKVRARFETSGIEFEIK